MIITDRTRAKIAHRQAKAKSNGWADAMWNKDDE